MQSTLILSGAGVLCRLLGMLYRVWLGNVLGTRGMGSYQLAYSVYAMLLVAASGGIPAALAAVCAKRMAKGDIAGAQAYFYSARRITRLLGIGAAVGLYVCSDGIGRLMGIEEGGHILRAAAPAVALVAIGGAYRGHAQGCQHMLPCGLAQICEQGIKLVAGLWLAGQWATKGEAWGAVGAMLGVTLSEAAGVLLLRLWHGKTPAAIPAEERRAKAAELLRMALPVTLSMAILPMLNSIDSLLSMELLQKAKLSQQAAMGAYGLYSGFVQPVVHLPGIFASAISAAMVPALAAAVANDRKDLLHHNISMGIRAVCLLGIPLTAVMWQLAFPILQTLYTGLSAKELAQATEMMRLMSPCALVTVMAQVSGSMLQGMGYMGRAAMHMAAGAVAKILLQWLLLPKIGIRGAAMGSVLCYLLTAAWNVMDVLRKGGGKYGFWQCFGAPLLATAGMCLVVKVVSSVVTGRGIVVLTGVLSAGAGVYIMVLWVLGTLKKEAWAMPKQEAPWPLTKRSA